MKKIYLACFPILGIVNVCKAQNTFPGTGNVGIGTLSPGTVLEVSAPSYTTQTNIAKFVNQTNGYYTTLSASGSASVVPSWLNGSQVLEFVSDPSSRSIVESYQSPLVFQTSRQDRMSIGLDGRVGIGTTSPQSNFEVHNNNYTDNNQFIISGSEPDRYYGVAGTKVPAGQTVFSLGTRSNYANYFETLNLRNGNVGIGTITPDAPLVVNGTIKTLLNTFLPEKNVVSITALGISGPTGANNWAIRGVYQYGNGVGLNADGGDLDIIKSLDGNTILGTNTSGAPLGNVGIGTTNPYFGTLQVNGSGDVLSLLAQGSALQLNGYSNNDFRIIQRENAPLTLWTNTTERLRVDAAGNVAIGTTDPRGFKLAVNGKAIAESMTVQLHANWPDYVFRKDHVLKPLSEVKNYIDQNQHLPEVPSEKEVAKDGIDLGEMNKVLLKKVEELTLYLIDQDKQNKEQQKVNAAQQQQINELKEQVAKLVKQQ